MAKPIDRTVLVWDEVGDDTMTLVVPLADNASTAKIAAETAKAVGNDPDDEAETWETVRRTDTAFSTLVEQKSERGHKSVIVVIW